MTRWVVRDADSRDRPAACRAARGPEGPPAWTKKNTGDNGYRRTIVWCVAFVVMVGSVVRQRPPGIGSLTKARLARPRSLHLSGDGGAEYLRCLFDLSEGDPDVIPKLSQNDAKRMQ